MSFDVVQVILGVLALVLAALAWRTNVAQAREAKQQAAREQMAERRRLFVDLLPNLTGAKRQYLRAAVATYHDWALDQLVGVLRPFEEPWRKHVRPLTSCKREDQAAQIRLHAFAMLAHAVLDGTAPSMEDLQSWLQKNLLMLSSELLDLEFRRGSADDAWDDWHKQRHSTRQPTM